MGLRDRLTTPPSARALLSWRIAPGVAVAAVATLAGVPLLGAIGIGLATYAVLVAIVGPATPRPPAIDPFALSEPWRQLVQRAQRARRELGAAVDGVADGPLRDALASVASQLDRGVEQAWAIARRGDEIDAAVRRLDPSGLAARLAVAERRAAAAPGQDTDAEVASVKRQIEAADRLRRQSDETAASLRLSQTRLDELVARAHEVGVGSVDTESYRRDVDDLVVRLEALHQAIEEIRTA